MPTALVSAVVAASLISGGSIDNAHVIFDSNMVLIFENGTLSKSLDTRYCYNSVAGRRVSRDIRKIISSGRLPDIDIVVVNDFFHHKLMSYNVVGHYTYNGKPVAEFCDHDELVVIKAAR